MRAQIGLKLKVEPDMLGVMCTRWPAACALRMSCVRARTSIPSTRRIRRPSVGVLIAESLCDQRLKRTRLRVGRLPRRVAGAVAWRERFAASVKAVGRLLLLLRVMWPHGCHGGKGASAAARWKRRCVPRARLLTLH